MTGDYDGSGEAVAMGEDGKLYFHNLGHCSCYGAVESGDFPNGGSCSIEDFKASASDVLDRTSEAIREKANELLGAG